jgi:hypothetical protein
LNKKSEKIISNPFVLNRSNQDDRHDASISSSQVVKSFYEQVVGSFEMKQKLIPYQGVLLNGVVHYFFFHTISHKREYFLSAEDSRVRSYLMNVYVKDRLQELSSQMFKHLFQRQCRIEVSPTYFDLKLFGGQLFDQLQISAFVAQPQLWLDSFFKIFFCVASDLSAHRSINKSTPDRINQYLVLSSFTGKAQRHRIERRF